MEASYICKAVYNMKPNEANSTRNHHTHGQLSILNDMKVFSLNSQVNDKKNGYLKFEQKLTLFTTAGRSLTICAGAFVDYRDFVLNDSEKSQSHGL